LARKLGAAFFIFFNPFLGKAAVANFGEEFLSFRRAFAE